MEELIEKDYRKMWLQSTSLLGRLLFGWLPIWAITQFFWWILAVKSHLIGEDINIMINILVAFGVPLIIPVLGERWIYVQRKKRGWSWAKDISKEWKEAYRMKIMEEQDSAKKKFAAQNGSDGDKSDIRYWHGLFKDGIISQDEFEGKKKELLN